jgi:hypothetical protein
MLAVARYVFTYSAIDRFLSGTRPDRKLSECECARLPRGQRKMASRQDPPCRDAVFACGWCKSAYRIRRIFEKRCECESAAPERAP